MPSAVFGVSSSVWLPEVVPAYAPEELLFEFEAPDEAAFVVPAVLPAPVLLLDELPEEPPDEAVPELPEDALLPPVLLPEPFPEPLPELEPPELLPEPPEEPPRSIDVLPAPLSSTSSFELELEPPLPILDVFSLTSTLTLPPEESSELSSLSSLLSEELPPSRLENG